MKKIKSILLISLFVFGITTVGESQTVVPCGWFGTSEIHQVGAAYNCTCSGWLAWCENGVIP